MDVSRPKFELSGARDALTQSRVLIHAFATDEVAKASWTFAGWNSRAR